MTGKLLPAARRLRDGRDDGGRDAGGLGVQAGLAGLAGLLLIGCLLVGSLRVFAPSLLPGVGTVANRTQDQQTAATIAAREVTTAFLDVDYRDMDPRVKRVLNLSTGTFRKQYAQTQVNLVAAAREGQAVSSGTVRYVGISQFSSDSAVLFVAADSTVSNLAMKQAQQKGQTVDDKRYYRFQLNMSRVDGRWLLSDLQFVS